MPALTNGHSNGINGIHADSKTPPILTGTVRHDPDFNVRNIMITGGAGFIASWVTRHLTLTYPKAYHIVCFDKLDYCATLNNTKCLDAVDNFSFVFGDINDQAAVLRCIKQYNIDTIMHFAAMSHVDLSFGNSFAFTETNVVGTHKLLEAAVKCNIKKFIHVSTDEVNGEHDGEDLKEDSLLKPTNPYAASKAAAEMYVEAYAKSYKLPCIIVRSNNVYGPHQYPEKIIPKFSCLLDRRLPLLIHGSGKNIRRYLYASDAADAFDTILHNGVAGQIYNVDSHDEVVNIDLAHKLLDHFNIPQSESHKWIKHTVDRPFNDFRYSVNADKLRSLGWRQKVRFEEGLKTTVDWYRQWGRQWWKGTDALFESGLPFPEVGGEGLVGMGTVRTPLLEVQQERLFAANAAAEGAGEGKENENPAAPGLLAVPSSSSSSSTTTTGRGFVPQLGASTQAAINAGAGGSQQQQQPVLQSGGAPEKRNTRKRARESEGEGKENHDLAAKRQMLGEDFGGEEVVR